jgi:Tfp pilus assembly protein PilN
MRAVNLLPPEESNGRSGGFDRALGAGVAVTVLVVILMAGGFMIEKAHASTERQRLATAQTALVQAQSQQPSAGQPAPKHLETPVVLSQEQPWHLALDSALATRVSWDVLLNQLEYVVPDNITVNNVIVGGAGTTAGTTSGTITIGGTAFSSNDIAVFLSTLARVPHISQVTLVSTTAGSGSSVQTFQITAQMALPAALTTAAPAPDTTTTTGG